MKIWTGFLFVGVVSVVATGIPACGGKADTEPVAGVGGSAQGTGGTAGSGGGDAGNDVEAGKDSSTVPPYLPTPNGKPMSEADACKMLLDAVVAQSIQLNCTMATPTCPNYIRSSAPSQQACLQWDEGTILGCADFYKSYVSCDDFASRPCIIGYIPNSAPNGCPADAGKD